jgi:hypothetical protein
MLAHGCREIPVTKKNAHTVIRPNKKSVDGPGSAWRRRPVVIIASSKSAA